MGDTGRRDPPARDGAAGRRLGRLVGWDPVPLTVRDARRMAGDAPSGSGRHATPSPATRAIELRRLIRGRPRRRSSRSARTSVDLSVGAGRDRGGDGPQRRRQDHAAARDRRRARARHGDGAGRRARAASPGSTRRLCPQEPDSILFADTVADEVARHAEGARARRRPTRDRCSTRSASRRSPDATRAICQPGSGCWWRRRPSRPAGRPCSLLDEPTRGLDPDAKDRLVAVPTSARGRRRGGDLRHARRGAGRRRRHARRDARRRRGDRRRRPRPRCSATPTCSRRR